MKRREAIKPTVLILCDYYLPAYKAGGPVRSLSRLTQRLGERFQFKVATSDRDLGDAQPYCRVQSGAWQRQGAADVLYLPPRFPPGTLAKLLRSTPHHLLYVNSLFSRRFSILPLVLRRVQGRRVPVLIAPRGELGRGAMAIRGGRKRAYIEVAKRLGLFDGVVWQATSSAEAEEIRRWFGRGAVVHVLPNLGPTVDEPVRALEKRVGTLKVLFLGRIAPKKNLLGALEALRAVSGTIEFSIAGPVDDRAYWRTCAAAIRTLPSSVRVKHLGAIFHEAVQRVIDDHHVMFLPTFDENYGHAIVEALARGRPVLISDRTPWTNLERVGAGWTFGPDDVEAFRKVLAQLVAVGDAEYGQLAAAARGYARDCLNADVALRSTRQVFEELSGDTCSCRSG